MIDRSVLPGSSGQSNVQICVGVAKTYRRGFFLGPGFPRGLGTPSIVPLAPGADRLTPFFFGPSVGGPIAEGAGVPSAGVASGAGVAALESEALSPFVLLAGGCEPEADTASVGESALAFMSLEGDSSLIESGASRARSLSGDTLRVTIKLALVLDLRRASADLTGGAMVLREVEVTKS